MATAVFPVVRMAPSGCPCAVLVAPRVPIVSLLVRVSSALSSRSSYLHPLSPASSFPRLPPLSATSTSSPTGDGSSSSSPSSASTSAAEDVPLPVVIIDQHSMEGATVVELEFGDRLGALLDTAQALTGLGLNVVKAKISTTERVGRNTFVITRSDTGQKVDSPELLEAIRLTILRNMLQYHPEASARLASMPQPISPLAPAPAPAPTPGQRVPLPTAIRVETEADGSRSALFISTPDKPGLLLEIVRVLKDLSINVESAEVDTEGELAKDQFYVTYHGQALTQNMVEVVSNVLRYFLTRPEIESEDSY